MKQMDRAISDGIRCIRHSPFDSRNVVERLEMCIWLSVTFDWMLEMCRQPSHFHVDDIQMDHWISSNNRWADRLNDILSLGNVCHGDDNQEIFYWKSIIDVKEDVQGKDFISKWKEFFVASRMTNSGRSSAECETKGNQRISYTPNTNTSDAMNDRV